MQLVATTSNRSDTLIENNISCYEMFTRGADLVRHKQRKRDMRFGTLNVSSLCRAGSLTAAAWELARYKLDLVGVQEVRWDKGGTVRAGDYNFIYGKRN